MKNLKVILLVSVSILLSSSFMSYKIPESPEELKMEEMNQDSIKWLAPPSSNDLVNPFKVNDTNIARGLLIYKKNCRSCHGRKGDGHGAGAIGMSPGDFTDSSFVDQTDGSMFWKISEGRTDMDPYKKTLDEEMIWYVVIYIKTFVRVSEE